jgi:TrmH family RNA methyltransferase
VNSKAAPKLVSSRDNPLFKRLKALGSSAQARKKEGLSILDGAHLVEACLASGRRPELVAVSESGMHRPEIARLVSAAGVEVTRFPDALFEALSTVVHGAGIVAALRTPCESLPAVIEGDCLLLEHLQDPGNMGSLLRSAAAAGVGRVFCSSHTVYAWSPKVLRAGQGAHFALQIVEGVDLAQVVARLRVPLLATTSHGSHSVYESDLARPVAWLFGNEGAGVSEALAARATTRVSIPMPGVAESLNVAAAGAICMFEAVRQRARVESGRR